MSTVYSIESDTQMSSVEEGNDLPFVPMGDRIPRVVAACPSVGLLDTFEMTYRHGLMGPFFDALAARYGVTKRTAAKTRELCRLAGVLGYVCERENIGRSSAVLLAHNAKSMSRNPTVNVKLANSTQTIEVLDDGAHCNGEALQYMLDLAVGAGDIELESFVDEREGRPAYQRRCMVITDNLRQLYRLHCEGNRYVDLTMGWSRTVNRTKTKSNDGTGQWFYQYHTWCTREVKELRMIEGEVDRYNTSLNGKVGAMYRGRFIPFAEYETRSHIVFHRTVKHGGRMYSKLQGVQDRLQLSLQGSPVYEEDFSSLHPSLAMNLQGCEAPDNMYDFVTCEGLTTEESRAIVKLIINCTLNCDSVQSGVKAAACQVQATEIEQADKRGIPYRKMHRYVHAMAKHVHKALPALFSTLDENTGRRLHRVDSDIARRVIREFVVAGLPVVNVHDSFVVRYEDRELLHTTMQAAYSEATGFHTRTKAQWLEDGRLVEKRRGVESGIKIPHVHVTADEVESHSGNKPAKP